ALHVRFADEAVCIGPAPANRSYLHIPAIISAAEITGADAIHPGYGFLSENAEFARICAKCNVTFIGPSPEAMLAWGDKVRARANAARFGLPLLHGSEVLSSPEHARSEAERIGLPIILKASGGGGGRGMRIVRSLDDVASNFVQASREAEAGFKNPDVFLERFIERPKHIEFQIIADHHGGIWTLGERECSLQRRHQKVMEEAPSPAMTAEQRQSIGEKIRTAIAETKYTSLGTLEFIMDEKGDLYFLEMNTRVQVEHPVTEMVTGLDLVAMQIRAAAGEKFHLTQAEVKIKGWAIESRIYAEDPYRNFLPSIGRLRAYQAPAEGKTGDVTLRNETGVREGDEISMFYDPMIAKLITHAPTRIAAIDAQAAALDNFLIDGIADNIPFLGAVMEEADFRKGDFTTAYIKQHFPDGFQGVPPSSEQEKLLIATAAIARSFTARRARDISGGINGGAKDWQRDWTVILNGAHHLTNVDLDDTGAAITINGKTYRLDTVARPGARIISGKFDGKPFSVKIKTAPGGYTLRHRGVTVLAQVATPRGAELHKKIPEKQKADTSKLIVSPMPGLVISIDVKPGQEVKSGEGVAVVEAMKMQNIIRAERDGVIATVNIAAGASVAADEVMIELA
ncbi:MAG: biotin carboxylase N-terminal domain-containing protein, partial [Terricaulis sp.]